MPIDPFADDKYLTPTGIKFKRFLLKIINGIASLFKKRA